MFSFHMNKMSIQHGADDMSLSRHRKLPFLEAIRLRRHMQPSTSQEERPLEEQPQPVRSQTKRSGRKQVQEKRQVPDRRKAVRPMLPDRENVGDRRKKNRRRASESI
jgi:hypothetical protein